MKAKVIIGLALVLISRVDAVIVHPKAPEGGQQIVYGNLDLKFLGVAHVEDLSIGEPYRCYYVGASNLASGQLLAGLKPGGWQYPLMRGSNVVGGVDMAAGKNDEKALAFAGLYKSNFSSEVLAATRAAEKLPQIKKQDYELRRLGIPAINFVAVWLHGKSDDIIMPLPPTYGRKLNAYEAYSESQIMKVLKPEAKEVMKAPKLER